MKKNSESVHLPQWFSKQVMAPLTMQFSEAKDAWCPVKHLPYFLIIKAAPNFPDL